MELDNVSEDDIFYRYLNDVVEFQFDQFHPYSEEDFFNTFAYRGGQSTLNMIQCPMFVGQGRKAHHSINDSRMNLGGPSAYTCRKHQSSYTVESGIIKPLLETFQTLVNREEGKNCLVDNQIVKVIPVSMGNDGNPLKPGIKYDTRLKRNVGLGVKCDEAFIKKNLNPLDTEWLKSHFVTEALVTYVTSLDDHDSLPIATDYVSRDGKTSS